MAPTYVTIPLTTALISIAAIVPPVVAVARPAPAVAAGAATAWLLVAVWTWRRALNLFGALIATAAIALLAPVIDEPLGRALGLSAPQARLAFVLTGMASIAVWAELGTRRLERGQPPVAT